MQRPFPGQACGNVIVLLPQRVRNTPLVDAGAIRQRHAIAHKLHPGIEYSILECCQMLLVIKRRVGQSKRNFTTKSSESIRIIYGCFGCKIVIVVMYVCNTHGRAPKCDCDYYVVAGKGGSQILYCAHCCEIYDKFVMNGAFGLIFKDK